MYEEKFRRHVLKVREEEGLSFEEAGKRFRIHKQTLYNWSKNIEAKKTRNKPPTKIPNEILLKDIELYPDAYQYERADRLGVSQRGIGHALKRLKITHKKKRKLTPRPAR